MVRISLKEAYDDRSVIKKIADLEVSKQDKLTAGQGVSIDNNVINVDTSSLATKAALSAESARLDQKIDKVDAKIPPLASKAELTDEVARLDARVDASNVKIKTNADAILTIEAELGSDALPGTIYYRIAKVENDVITLKPLVNDSIKKVDVEGDASTVYHRALHNSGIVENDALPVASDTKAGVMSAGMYIGFNSSIQNLQARMAVVEGVGITYQLTGLPDNATSEQITAAFREQYPNVPLMAGIRAVDYDKAKIWQYSGTSWIQLTNINIDKATSTALGVVKGSETSTTNEGKIFVEVDGSMTVIGWDTLKALATAAKQSVDNLEPRVTQQSAKIDALEGDVAANAADITALQGTSTNHESRISALESDMNNVKPRVGQLESDVSALQTQSSQNTQDINNLDKEVQGKQDKLTAGAGVSIEGNVISALPGEGKKIYQQNLSTLFTITADSLQLSKDVDIEFIKFGGNFRSVSVAQIKTFSIAKNPNFPIVYVGEINTSHGGSFLQFDFATSSMSITIGGVKYVGDDLNNQQIVSTSGDVPTPQSNQGYFRIWA